MPVANPQTYLYDLVELFKTYWPENRPVNIACHGHSVPAGYFATPLVDTFNAYPHLLHVGLKQRYPYAALNVVVTAIGGETSDLGAARFERDVLGLHPDVVTIDYGLNDRRVGLAKARQSWQAMIEAALGRGAKVLLLTPTMDVTQAPDYAGDDQEALPAQAAQIRSLATEYGVGLADSFAAFQGYLQKGVLDDLLSWPNHPNRKGHELVAQELLRWFPIH